MKYLTVRLIPKVKYNPDSYEHVKYIIEKDLKQSPFYDLEIHDVDNEDYNER